MLIFFLLERLEDTFLCIQCLELCLKYHFIKGGGSTTHYHYPDLYSSVLWDDTHRDAMVEDVGGSTQY